MKPRIQLAAVKTPEGRMELFEHDGSYLLYLAEKMTAHTVVKFDKTRMRIQPTG